VLIFDPSMPTSQIQATVDAIATQQVSNQFGTQRYALLFKPGVYGTTQTPLIINVGYYPDVAGLGAQPDQGKATPIMQKLPSPLLHSHNFWSSHPLLKITTAA
jgi:hypothetical protein